MKKILLSLVVVLTAMLVVSNHSYGQSSTKTVSLAAFKQISSSPNLPASIGPMTEISSKALKNFHRMFVEVSGERWLAADGGFVVMFSKNGIKNRVDYDKKGKLLTIFRYYGEDQLPRDVRHLVKSTYYDYSITHIVEVTVGNKTAYLLNIQDATTLKQLKVVDGEMEVTQDYILSK